MQSSFAPIGQIHRTHDAENTFWPSFTDIMMVITMIFLMATSLLVARNWQLVKDLQTSIAAEQLASRTIEITAQENATLEERLANAEQRNLTLRLQNLKKDEALRDATSNLNQQQTRINQLAHQITELNQALGNADDAAQILALEIQHLTVEKQALINQLTETQQRLKQTTATYEQKIIDYDNAITSYNQQLSTLKDNYDSIKTKYDELFKPARSAKGKYIAEVYIADKKGETMRYKQPSDSGFTTLSLSEIEQRLDELKKQKGKDLYVKVIIPEDSDLTYNEAWNFTRNLLVKYDYYYQE